EIRGLIIHLRILGVKANGTTASTSGQLTIVPVDDTHPCATKVNEALDYYWKMKVVGFDDLTDNVVSMEFDNSTNVDKDFRVAYLLDRDWEAGSTKLGLGVSVLTFDNTATYGNFSRFINADFSAGNENKTFKKVDVFYSRQNAEWFSDVAWLDEAYIPTSKEPGKADIAVIRNGHRIYVEQGANTINIGMLEFEHDTTISTGIEDLPRLQVDLDNTLNLNRIKGTGILTQWIDNADNPVITGDFGEFVDEKYSWFLYVASAGAVDIPATLSVYPNVMTEGDGNTLTFTNDVVINRHLNPRGNSTLLLNDGATGDIVIGGDLIIGDYLQGKLEFASTGAARTLTIDGNIDFTASVSVPDNKRQINVLNTSPSSLEHSIVLGGDIIQGAGVLDLANTGVNANNANIEFTGSNSAVVSKSVSEVTDFYKLQINKSSDEKVHFTGDFALIGPTNTTTKALDLQSGECHLDNSGIDIDLSTGGGDFKIPTGTMLRVDNGATVNVSGSSTGIWLDDELIIDNSGKVYCNGGSDNYIEYSASGNASIWVGDVAELIVGSQIRRNDVTEEGILSFTQAKASSTITIGEDDAPTNDRGVFEILNAGSSFTQSETGSNITIVRSQTAPSKAALLFDPATSSIATGSGFTIGNASTPAGQTIGVYAGQNLMDLTIEGANAPTAQVWIVPITLDGDLTINTGALDANGLDVTLKGNLANSGTYTANGNTTYLEGIADQTITGNTTFYNLLKQSTASALNIGAATAVTVTNDLNLQTGTLNTGDNTISVSGDLTNEITTSSTGASQGILMNGTEIQEINGSGTYDVLTIDNSSGIVLPTQSSAISFIDRLRLIDGIFDIGRNLLVLQENAYVEDVNPFSASNMIQTNLSFVDAGIEKYFPVIAASTNFTYPIGSLGKYTPVDMDITNNGNNTGSVRVKAANERHISIIDHGGTPYDDTQNVLQYNWTLDADGIENFTASVVMTGDGGDVSVTAPNTSADYITARILLASTDWNKFTTTDFNEGTTELSFTFSGTDDLGIDGDYTAGVSDAIPDQVPSFITVADGPWTTTTTWAAYDPDIPAIGSPGVDVPAGGPRGSIVYVNHDLTLPVNFEAAYRTVINTSGVVDIASSIGHRLGDVSGTGTIKLENGDLPSGVYDDFFSANGGTVEYSGSTAYDILSEITTVNNLVLSGTNQRRFPDLDIQLLGDLTMSGADVENTNNRNLSVKGNIVFSGGTYDAGTTVGPKVPTITLNGSSLQSVSGTIGFTAAGGGALYDLEINNSAGADIANDIEVEDKLILTDGVLNTAAGGRLVVTNALASAVTGGSDTAYVQGPLSKSINNGDNFTFPVGDALRYSSIVVATDGTSGGIWEVQYYNHNPGDDAKAPDSMTGGISYVSHNEYWRVKAPAPGNATLTLYWDNQSGVTPDGNFRMVEWADLATDAWQEVSNNAPVGDEAGGHVTSSSVVAFNEFAEGGFYTFGTILVPAYTWEGDDGTSPSDWFTAANWSGGIVPNAASDVTIANVANDPEIDYTSLVQVNDLTINAGATLTLLEGARMTVNGDAVTNNGLIIENTTTNPTSFINIGTVTGDVSVQWSYPEKRYWYIGHAISNVNVANYDALVDGGNAYVLYAYAAGAWNNITGVGDGFSEPLKGYSFNVRDAGAVVSHQGSLNVLDFTGVNARTLSDGWQLMANPYAAYLDLESSDDWEFGSIRFTIYTKTTIGAERANSAYNLIENVGTNGGTRYLAPGQSFWVKHYGTDDFGVALGARTHATGSLKSSAIEPNDILRLTLSNQHTTDEIALLFRSSGSVTRGGQSDSEKRLESNDKIPYLYSIKDEGRLSINTLPEIDEAISVLLGFQVGAQGAGEMTLSVGNMDHFLPKISVYLEDMEKGEWIDLRLHPHYTFATSAMRNNERFVLHFAEAVSTGSEEVFISTTSKVNIYVVNGKVIIEVPHELLSKAKGAGRAKIYTLKGELIQDTSVLDSRTVIALTGGPGVYLVKVNMGTEAGAEVKKVAKLK
ncbi:MAG: hypothetical protein JEZ14_17820, partial [Marinilabiliaceae bacterium]|nr:hypothetical protein [Marinilabiliaceae bacterium]